MRRALTCLLAVFLLLMQTETLRHALEHVGAQLQRIDHGVLERSAADSCIECGLLAGGANAAVSVAPGFSAAKLEADAIAALCGRLAVPALRYYSSRAPPAFLQHA